MQPFETIWAETSQRIRNFIRGRVGDDATADDLLQEVFVRVHQNMASLKDTERLERLDLPNHAPCDYRSLPVSTE